MGILRFTARKQDKLQSHPLRIDPSHPTIDSLGQEQQMTAKTTSQIIRQLSSRESREGVRKTPQNLKVVQEKKLELRRAKKTALAIQVVVDIRSVEPLACSL